MKKQLLLLIMILAGAWANGQNTAPKPATIDSAILRAQKDTTLAKLLKASADTSHPKHFQSPIFGSYKTNIIIGSVALPASAALAAGAIIYSRVGTTDVTRNVIALSIFSGGFAILGGVMLGTGLKAKHEFRVSQKTSMNIGVGGSGAELTVQF